MASHPIDPDIIRERIRVGAIVRSLREYRNLRQEGLSHLSGVGDRQIRSIESGAVNTGIDTFIKLARGLDVPLPTLFAEDWLSRLETDQGNRA